MKLMNIYFIYFVKSGTQKQKRWKLPPNNVPPSPSTSVEKTCNKVHANDERLKKIKLLTCSDTGAVFGAFLFGPSPLLSSAFGGSSSPVPCPGPSAVAHEADPVSGAAGRLWQPVYFFPFYLKRSWTLCCPQVLCCPPLLRHLHAENGSLSWCLKYKIMASASNCTLENNL